MKKLFYIVGLLLLAATGYYLGFEARLFGWDYFSVGMRYDIKLDVLLVFFAVLIALLLFNALKEGGRRSILLAIILMITAASPPGGFQNNSPRIWNILLFGASPGNSVNDGVTNSTTTLTSATANFTQADVGKIIEVTGAGVANATLKTTIASVSNSTTIILSVGASSSHTSVNFSYGFDATTGIQSAILACSAGGGGDVYFPHAWWIINGALVTSDNNGNNPNSQIYIPSINPYTNSYYGGIRLIGEYSKMNLGGGYAVADPHPISTAGVFLLSTLTSASGTNPSIIGTAPIATEPYNFQDIDIDFITTVAYTNSGKAAPILTGINMQYANKICMNQTAAIIDVPGTASHDASGTETAGMIISGVNNTGPNTLRKTDVVGYKYAYIVGEHTYLDGVYSLACYIGITSGLNNYEVSGTAAITGTAYGLFMPTAGTIMGITTGITKWKILISYEVAPQGIWYDPLAIVSDVNNNARGTIELVSQAALTVSGGTLAVIREVSAQFPYIKPDGTIHPLGVNISGQAVMTVQNTSAVSSANMILRVLNDNNNFVQFGIFGHNYTPSGLFGNDVGFVGGGTSGANFLYGTNAGDHIWSTDANSTAKMRLKSGGDLLLGTSTDNGIITAAGVIAPEANGTRDIGTSSFLWRNVFANGLVGTTTNNNASAGNVGEYVNSLVAIGSPVSLSNGIAANITSISLTAGDWDVDGEVSFTETTSTVTARSAGITSTTGVVPVDGSEGYCGVQSTVTSETNSIALTKKRFTLSGTTTIFLVGKASFSAGTCGGFGNLSARRVR